MNKVKITAVMNLIEKVLSQHKEDFKQAGITVTTGNAKFNENSATLKLSIVDLTADGKVVDLKKENWDKYAVMYGLKKEWLGREITMSGKVFKITGFEPKKRTNPIVIEGNGKSYVTSIENIKLRIKE